MIGSCDGDCTETGFKSITGMYTRTYEVFYTPVGFVRTLRSHTYKIVEKKTTKNDVCTNIHFAINKEPSDSIQEKFLETISDKFVVVRVLFVAVLESTPVSKEKRRVAPFRKHRYSSTLPIKTSRCKYKHVWKDPQQSAAVAAAVFRASGAAFCLPCSGATTRARPD